jgi:nickel/cobalt transporter (NicO) family protein
MKIVLLAVIALFGVLASTPMLADPFHKSAPRPPSETAVDGPSLDSGFVTWLAERQHRLNESIADAFHDVETGQSRAALVLILGLAFFYGVLHAAGPGHGKTVVASYFVAHHARWTSGILMGSLISLIQGVSAIVLVGTLAIVLRAKQIEILNRSTMVEFVSYGLIVAIGVWTFYRAVTGELHPHHEGGGNNHDHPADHHHKLDPRLILATGLTPCASAIIILLFALANSAFGLGVIAVTVLTVGMAVTISTIGVAAVLGRRAVIAMIDKAGMETHRLERGLAMAAAMVIIAVSGLMMYDAWTRL